VSRVPRNTKRARPAHRRRLRRRSTGSVLAASVSLHPGAKAKAPAAYAAQAPLRAPFPSRPCAGHRGSTTRLLLRLQMWLVNADDAVQLHQRDRTGDAIRRQALCQLEGVNACLERVVVEATGNPAWIGARRRQVPREA